MNSEFVMLGRTGNKFTQLGQLCCIRHVINVENQGRFLTAEVKK